MVMSLLADINKYTFINNLSETSVSLFFGIDKVKQRVYYLIIKGVIMVGLEQYLKHENKSYVDAAKCFLYDAIMLEKKQLTRKTFELFKNLIYDGNHFPAILEVIQKAYCEFKQDAKKGLRTPEDISYVKREVEYTNKLINLAYYELSKEGREVKHGPKESKVDALDLSL